ncbi:MAG: DUF4430 domain-containing protein [Clostridia bacterium]|nr:DUF4430 domain-containing protein [Clostridia bacterium]
MKTNFLRKFFSYIFVFIFIAGTLSVSAQEATVDKAQSLIDGIVAYKLKNTACDSVQQYIDRFLSKNPGSDEWYALTLCQYGNYNFQSYQAALTKYLSENKVTSASTRQKYALILIGIGSGDRFIYHTLNDSIGKQGIMSWIFGLHLLNNGYQSEAYTATAVKEKLLSLQHADGGWSVTGPSGDVDATAMAIQSLASFYQTDAKTKSAVDKALQFLSAQQKPTGDFATYGVENPESTAQVLTALSALGINCLKDQRFIKDDKTLFDVVEKYRLPDGSFCHQTGGEYSGNATVQVLYSLVSFIRMNRGKAGLYMMDKRNPSILDVPQKSEITVSPEQKNAVSGEEKNENIQKNHSTEHSAGTESETEKSVGDAETSETVAEISGQNTSSLEDSLTTGEVEQTKTGAFKKAKWISYKFYIIFGAVIALALTYAILLFKKNKNKKNYMLAFFVFAGVVLFALFIHIQSPDDYYNSHRTEGEAVGTVTVTIRCDTIQDRSAAHIPENGVFLDAQEIEFEKGSSVYDVLVDTTAQNRIHMESSGTNQSPYVKGIGNIYEFDYGDLSGWMYFVNGKSPSIGCGEYKVKDGDRIEWLYTCNLGKDIQK